MNNDELYHYGVKGMKWGVRKAVNKAANLTGKAARNTTRSLEGRTLFGENAVGRNRRAAKQHNLEIKRNYQNAKAKVKNKEISRFSKEYRQAKGARVKNLAGRAITQQMGFTDSGRGAYYRNRQMGESKAKSALKAMGRQTVTNLQFTMTPGGMAVTSVGEQYLRAAGVIS